MFHLVRIAPMQAKGDQEQGNQDESVRGVEVGEDQAGQRQAKHNVAEDEGEMKELLPV